MSTDTRTLIGIRDWPSMMLARIIRGAVCKVSWSTDGAWWIADAYGDKYTTTIAMGPVLNRDYPETVHYMVVLWRLRIDFLRVKEVAV